MGMWVLEMPERSGMRSTNAPEIVEGIAAAAFRTREACHFMDVTLERVLRDLGGIDGSIMARARRRGGSLRGERRNE
ncbi:MAG: hypothetical protein ACK58T_46440 [Phycisphaerae bacterium]|jgi:hypothetical protein